MAKAPSKPAKLPPPTARQCWGAFLKWVLGVPLVCAGGLGTIGFALWAAGGQDLMWQTTRDMGTALFWIVGILLMYPLLTFMWVAELRTGLKAARDWDAMTPEAQATAVAEAKALRLATRQKRTDRKAKARNAKARNAEARNAEE
jgi:hypothetical protein